MRTSESQPTQTAHTRVKRRQRMRWVLWRARFFISAAAAAAAIMLVVNEVRPATPPTDAVVALRNDVPAGEPLTAKDLHLVRMPSKLIPDGAYTDTDDVIGQTAALALSTTTVLSHSLVAGDAARDHAPAGTVIVPVRLSDATITKFVQVGDHVDLVLVAESQFDAWEDVEADPADRISEGEITTLAKRALILPTPAGDASEPTGLLGSPASTDDPGDFLLVAVSPKEAKTLTAAARAGYIGAVLVE